MVIGKTRNNMVIGHRLPYDMVGKHVKSVGTITARQIAVMQPGIADAMQRCPRLFPGLFPLGPRLEYYNHTSGLSVFDVPHGDSAYYPTLQHTDTMEVAVRGGLRCLQTLRKLQLCGNKLRSKGAKTLLVALRGHPALTQL